VPRGAGGRCAGQRATGQVDLRLVAGRRRGPVPGRRHVGYGRSFAADSRPGRPWRNHRGITCTDADPITRYP